MPHQSLAAGSDLPKITVPKAGGGEIHLGGERSWRVVVVYRGKHCPICRTYLKTLDELLDQFREIRVEVVAISADTPEKAEAQLKEEGWRFPVGHSLTPDQMRSLGLYISEPRSIQETDRPFPEPGLFVINSEGKIQVLDVSNAPFARPDPNGILRGGKVYSGKAIPHPRNALVINGGGGEYKLSGLNDISTFCVEGRPRTLPVFARRAG